jgi:hypothetical protein
LAFGEQRLAEATLRAGREPSSLSGRKEGLMPHTVRKGKGSKPWKIVNKDTGETKGSSKTKKKAQASARIRDQRAND